MDQDLTPQPRSAAGSKLVGALIGAVAALSIGGVGLAFAQEAETPTTEAPSAETTPAAPSDEDCPDKAGDARRGSSAADTGAEV